MTADNQPSKASVFVDLMKGRRSFYQLQKEGVSISNARIQEIVLEVLHQTPSCFNSRSNRILLLFGDEHDKLWDLTSAELRRLTPDEKWEAVNGRNEMFKAAYGTVLFFEDKSVVDGLQAKMPHLTTQFPLWANQSQGMLHYNTWTALEAEGLGANLQHYNIVEKQVGETWSIPETWTLQAQLVFGARAGEPRQKEFLPAEQIFKVAGA